MVRDSGFCLQESVSLLAATLLAATLLAATRPRLCKRRTWTTLMSYRGMRRMHSLCSGARYRSTLKDTAGTPYYPGSSIPYNHLPTTDHRQPVPDLLHKRVL